MLCTMHNLFLPRQFRCSAARFGGKFAPSQKSRDYMWGHVLRGVQITGKSNLEKCSLIRTEAALRMGKSKSLGEARVIPPTNV